MQGFTKSTKGAQIARVWYLIDAKDKILGRVGTEVAELLMGKRKPYFVRSQDMGDYVVVVNAERVRVTGKKEEKKKYTRYSGYPGGLRVEMLGELRKRKPTEVIKHAVSGMLPKNRLRDRMLKRLFVFAGEEHPYKNKFKI